MLENMKNRLDWIDISKFISITLVIWLHFGAPHFIDIFVHLFHMPVFFFLSGLCFRPEKYESFSLFAANRARRLLRPYLIVAVLSYLFWTPIHWLVIPERVVSVPLFLRTLLFVNTTPVPPITYLWGGIQWFLTSLFFCELLFFTIYKSFPNSIIRNIVCTFISLIVIFIYSSQNFIRLPLAFDTALVALSFYCFGFYFRKINFKEAELSKNVLYLLLSLFATAIIFFFTRATNLRLMKFGRIPILYLPGGLFGSLSIIFAGNIFDKIIKNSQLRNNMFLLGRNTLFLLYSHRFFDGIDKTILHLAGVDFPSKNIKGIYFIIMIIVFLIISIPILNIWEKQKSKL